MVVAGCFLCLELRTVKERRVTAELYVFYHSQPIILPCLGAKGDEWYAFHPPDLTKISAISLKIKWSSLNKNENVNSSLGIVQPTTR